MKAGDKVAWKGNRASWYRGRVLVVLSHSNEIAVSCDESGMVYWFNHEMHGSGNFRLIDSEQKEQEG